MNKILFLHQTSHYFLLFTLFSSLDLFTLLIQQLLHSDGDNVHLRKVTAASSGVYRCEVTTEDSYTPLVGEGVMNVSGESIIFTCFWDHQVKMYLSLLPENNLPDDSKKFHWRVKMFLLVFLSLHTSYTSLCSSLSWLCCCHCLCRDDHHLLVAVINILDNFITININRRHQALVQDLIPWEGVGVSLPTLPDNHPVEGVSLFYHLSFTFQRRSWHVEPLHIIFTRWLLCLGWHDVNKKQVSGDYLWIFVVYITEIIDCHSLTKDLWSLYLNICSSHS